MVLLLVLLLLTLLLLLLLLLSSSVLPSSHMSSRRFAHIPDKMFRHISVSVSNIKTFQHPSLWSGSSELQLVSATGHIRSSSGTYTLLRSSPLAIGEQVVDLIVVSLSELNPWECVYLQLCSSDDKDVQATLRVMVLFMQYGLPLRSAVDDSIFLIALFVIYNIQATCSHFLSMLRRISVLPNVN